MSTNRNFGQYVPYAILAIVGNLIVAWFLSDYTALSFGPALAVSLLIMAAIGGGVLFLRRQSNKPPQLADARVDDDDAKPQHPADGDSEPSSDSDREPQTADRLRPPAVVEPDDTPTGQVNTALVRAALAAVPEPQGNEVAISETDALDLPDSIADLASYFERLHPWSFYRHIVTAGLLGFLMMVLIGWLSIREGPWTEVFVATPWILPALWLLWLLGAGLAVVLLIRRHKIWAMRPLSCDPRSGILTIFETGSRLWVIPNSEPDQYPLSEVSIDSPKQTWFEQYVLGDSFTLVLSGEGRPRVIRYVRDIRKIKDIAAAYRSIITQQRDLQRLILRETRLHRQEQQRTNELLQQLLATNQRVEVSLERLPGT